VFSRLFFAAALISPLLLLRAQPQSAAAAIASGILETRCHACHSAQTKMAGIQLTSSVDVAQNKDRILTAIGYSGKVKMPPSGKLSAGEIQALTTWIASGANFPAVSSAAKPAPSWWAFRKVTKPQVPQTGETNNPIDAFLQAKLAAAKLAPAPQADKRTLIRRATFDLHGIPPTAAEIEAFAADNSPDAYSKLIDRLLASPRYGEKWGKHWLDLARYGDTSGFEQDPYQLYAWRYRDYVIKSFNDDKPYDRFVKETIAGDEIFPEEVEAQQGTGFYTVGTNRDMLYKVEDINREESLTDFTDTTASVFLGLTAGCARCHDHKFDPIPQRDYFRLQAVFSPFLKTRVFLKYNDARGYDLSENTRTFRLYEIGAQLKALLDPHRDRLRNARLDKLPAEVATAYRTPEDAKTPEQKAIADAYAKKVEPSDDEVYAQLSKDEFERLHKIERRLVSMYKSYGPGPFSPGLTDVGREAPRTFLPAKAGGEMTEVRAGMPSILGGEDIQDPPLDSPTTLRRKALAEWIARPDNPLTARVMVNRIWHYHFGRGLVATPSDFGTRAGLPSHPELLDWLATEFVDRKWSIKQMHKLLMTSAAYQRVSRALAKAQESDPENTLLSHFTRRRLDSEEVRDAVLAAAGSLHFKMYGRPVVPPLAVEELYGMSQPLNNAWIVTEDPKEHTRRSIYLISRRNFRVPLLEAFDRPEGVLSCSRRESSTTAPQSLSLLNGEFTQQQAQVLASKIESASDPVAAAFQAVFGRLPSESESARTKQFLENQTKNLGSRQAALHELARGLFNTNEFLYVE
jgi:cytochrome c5